MSQESEEPRFPDITPTHIVQSQFHVIEDDDIRSEEDLRQLLELMYEYPERAFYLFAAKDRGINHRIVSAERLGFVRYLSEEFFYFRHPKYQRDYVRILEHQIQWDWEREVFAKGPMFVRVSLGLTRKAERQFEHVEIAMKQKEKNPLILKPTFFGMGIDLPKLWAWIRERTWSRKT